MVVGEPQILGQMKEHYAAAASAGMSGTVLHRVFHRAFAVAKRIRTETGIAGKAVSVASVAVDLTRTIFESLTDKTAMLIGAGKMSELVARHLRAHGISGIVVATRTFDHAVELARILSDAEGVAALELNISCPNIKEGGITFGCSLTGTHAVVSAVRKVTQLPVIPKLTPNVTDVASFARAAEDAGADAVSLVNTFLAMAIDVETRGPTITNVLGGLSGPAIRPIAVRMVWECAREVKIPVIGMGGITDARDALEFILAGATAVQIGTQNFVDPFVWGKVLDGLTDYLVRHKVGRIDDLVGSFDTTPPRPVHA